MQDLQDQKAPVIEHPYFDNTALIERKGPYGFFHVRLKHGETPPILKEQLFTSVDYAILAINLEAQNKESSRKSKEKV